MSGTDTLLCLSFLFLGVSIGVAGSISTVQERTRTSDIEWVETCWPNKPVWTEGPGTCWVNGQKVVVE